MMKKRLRKPWIVVVSLLLTSCQPTPEGRAEEWCLINRRIKNASSEAEIKQLTEQAIRLEEDIKEEFEHDSEAMNIIYSITHECD